MSFPYYTIIVTYFMATLGLAAVTLVAPVSPNFILITAGALLASLPLNIKNRRIIPPRVWSLLAVFLLVLFFFDYMGGSLSLIVSGVRFLTVLLAFKLFDVKNIRDHIIVYAIVFFLILAAAASTVSPAFILILALFIIGSIFAMIILSIKKDIQVQGLSDIPAWLFGFRFFASIITVSAIALLITFALFFMIPRMGVGFFEKKTLNTVKVSGFSENVKLGSIGAVKTDSTVVMRIELPGRDSGPFEGPMYLRGTALGRYDGRTWSRSGESSFLVKKKGDGFFTIRAPDMIRRPRSPRPTSAPWSRRGLIKQKILLEPLETEVLFTIPHAVSIAGRFPNLWSDSGSAIYLPSPPYSRIEYTAWSSPSPLPGHLRTGRGEASGPDNQELREFLETPYTETDPAYARIRALVKELTSSEESDMDKARAIERYLKTNYAYTLSPGRGGGQDPLDDFLFYSKEGYCEQYATALAVMLRIAGIPSRLVTGFLQGEWNGFGNYFIVRQSDAHSWVEAYISARHAMPDGHSVPGRHSVPGGHSAPGRHSMPGGWVTFEPTPPAGITPVERSQVFLYLDMLRMRWNRYIINYTFEDQTRAALAMETNTSRLVGVLRESLPKAMRPSRYSIAFAAGVLLLLAALMLRSRREGTKKRFPKTPRFYLEMLRILSKKGLRARAGETPMEFALRVDNIQVLDLTTDFQSERYGGLPPGPRDLARIKTALETLRRMKPLRNL